LLPKVCKKIFSGGRSVSGFSLRGLIWIKIVWIYETALVLTAEIFVSFISFLADYFLADQAERNPVL
jgi:hypothetical protein